MIKCNTCYIQLCSFCGNFCLCDNIVCKNCEIKCYECENNLCNKCVVKCKICDKHGCIECMLSCGKCGDSFCHDEYMSSSIFVGNHDILYCKLCLHEQCEMHLLSLQ